MGTCNSNSRSSASGAGSGGFSIANLPQLEGTEKQINYANDLRSSYVNSLQKMVQANEDGDFSYTNGVGNLEHTRRMLESVMGFEESQRIAKKAKLTKEEKAPIREKFKGAESIAVGNIKSYDRTRYELEKEQGKKIAAVMKQEMDNIRKAISSKTKAKFWIEI